VKTHLFQVRFLLEKMGIYFNVVKFERVVLVGTVIRGSFENAYISVFIVVI